MSDEQSSCEPDVERAETLREIGDDIRGDSSESKLVAAILYRISDLYDPDEETTPEEIYRNVQYILEVKERGGIDR